MNKKWLILRLPSRLSGGKGLFPPSYCFSAASYMVYEDMGALVDLGMPWLSKPWPFQKFLSLTLPSFFLHFGQSVKLDRLPFLAADVVCGNKIRKLDLRVLWY